MDDEHSDEGGFSLALPFLTDSREFAYGVEVGILWQRMKTERHLDEMCLLANQEQILLMLNRARWRVERAEVVAKGWFHLVASAPAEGE
ncbi:MAG: hypothetical protein E6Q76_09660 [Rhizobium sp.]|nr:MAG: hypothetical protein E6Q76_09660 [Rhizobium sp.]